MRRRLGSANVLVRCVRRSLRPGGRIAGATMQMLSAAACAGARTISIVDVAAIVGLSTTCMIRSRHRIGVNVVPMLAAV
jgi:hypothetical protein